MGIGTPVALLVGMLLVLGAVGLFFFDKIKPAYARDSDKVYAAFILLAGLVTLVNWGMEAGPSFLMFVMSGMLTTLLIENVRNREPRVVETLPPYDKRSQRPRYGERPPVQRGYRAEIDRDPYRDRPPADLPLRRQPRMNPAQEAAQEAAWSNSYDSADRMRQPYEEYRGPAGRLQPSRQPDSAGPPDNRYSDNERYGQRPPAQRPPNPGSPNLGPPNSGPLNPGPPNPGPPNPGPFNPGAPAQRPPNQMSPEQRPPVQNTGQRPPQRDPQQNGRPDSEPTGLSASNRRPEESTGERPPRSEGSRDRSLNIRPLSEAPKFDDDYRPNTPEGAPS